MITTAQVCTASQEGPRVQVYYLDGDTDHDTHDTACCCTTPSKLPHKAVGASLYKLDLEGARAWHARHIGADTDSFADWCQRQESQGTYYGVDSKAAMAAAIVQARLDGWHIINFPEPVKWPLPLDYRDSRANYQDTILYYQHCSEPDNPPLPIADIAPFPLWIVPPGYRMARFSDIAAATGYTLSPDDAGALLALAGVNYAPTVSPLWGWKDAVITWPVEKTGDFLVFWQSGRA